jgi:predicted AAA+ superfamily ATPase
MTAMVTWIQLIAHLPPLAEFGFYRTAVGAKLDLVVEYGGRRTGYEIKLSNAPRPAHGFWTVCEDLGLDRARVISPVREGYPMADNVGVIPPQRMFTTLMD